MKKLYEVELNSKGSPNFSTAVEVSERKTGKWIDEGFYADGHGVHAFRCSECGGHIIEYDPDPFCKWCGVDMRGEQDESD